MKFKKILALVLAVLAVLSMATVAMAEEPEEEIVTYNITFTQQYQTSVLRTAIVSEGKSIGEAGGFPDTLEDAGRVCVGWFYVNPTEFTKIYVDETFVPTDDLTIIAEMKNAYTIQCVVPGVGEVAQWKIAQGSPLGELPDAPDNAGQRFEYWYYYENGEKVVVSEQTCPTSDLYLNAWYVDVYGVKIGSTGLGTVTSSADAAALGEKVYLNVSAPFGFVLGSLTVTTYDGQEVKVKRADGEYYFIMPDEPVKVDASFVPLVIPSYGVSYDDVADTAWYADAVDYVTRNGLMDGTGNGQFSPNVTTTRAMLVTILYRLDGAYVDGVSAFTDVPDNTWYTNAVVWANDLGLVTGYGDGTFGPDDPVTREQMAAILQRYAAFLGYDVTLRADLSAYQDASSISAYAADSMAWANASGLINGVGHDRLNPKGDATRAEVAAILQRFCENIMF